MYVRANPSHLWLVIAVLGFAGPALAGGHAWSKRFGDSNGQSAASLAFDSGGNLVVTGSFFGTMDLGGGALASSGQQDVFVAKFDANGNHLWSRRFGDADIQVGKSLAIDGLGNVIVTGWFNGAINFGGGPLVSAGASDIFVVKFDANGNLVWNKRFGDSSAQTVGDIARDSAGNLIALGSFAGSVDFGGGALASAGQTDIYLVKLDASGSHLWSKRFGDASAQAGNGLVVDAPGNLIATGSFNGSVNFGGTAMTSAGGSDTYLVKFDPNGGYVWNKRFGDAANQTGNDVAIDAAGNPSAIGSFAGTINFGGGNLVSAGLQDIYLAHFDSSGGNLWGRAFGGSSDDSGNAIAVNVSGNCIVTGSFQGTVAFGGLSLVGAGSSDIFLARYGPGGQHLSSARFGDADAQFGSTVALAAGGEAIVAGDFRGSVDLGGGLLTSAGGYDVFLAKFGDAIFRDGF